MFLDGVVDCWIVVELCGIVSNVKMMFEDIIMFVFYIDVGYICLFEKFEGKSILIV